MLKTGNSSKRAMQKAERDARRASSNGDNGRDAGVTASSEQIDIDV
jgi:hypothetical protein